MNSRGREGVDPKQHSKWDEICSQNVNLCFLCRLVLGLLLHPSIVFLPSHLTSSPLTRSAIQTFFEDAAAAEAGIFSNAAAPSLRPSVRITAFYPMKVARQKNVSKHIKSVGGNAARRKQKRRGTIRFENKSDSATFCKAMTQWSAAAPLFGDLNPRPRIR